VSGQVRLLVVADAHIAAPGTAPQRWHSELVFGGSDRRLAEALRSRARLGADLAVLLGDVLNKPMESMVPAAFAAPDAAGLRLVTGNEDPPSLRAIAPPGCLASLSGEVLGSWLRLAGIHAVSEDGGATARVADPVPVDPWEGETAALLSHFPLLSRSAAFAGAGLAYADDLLDRSPWAEALLARSAPTVVLCGHLHARDSVSAGRVLQLGFGALIEPPHEIALVELDPGNGYPRVRRRTLELGGAVPERDPALAPRVEEWAFDGDRWQRVEAASPPSRTVLAAAGATSE
jgi:hypothetical protein